MIDERNENELAALSPVDEELFSKLLQIDDVTERNRQLDIACDQNTERHVLLQQYLEQHKVADQMFAAFDPPKREPDVTQLNDTSIIGERLLNAPIELLRTNTGIGRSLGHYDLVRLVGQGGMGNVFLARDRRLGREVALKIPRLEILGSPGMERRFLREAQTAAGLDHPGLVSILEIASDGAFLFIASQWCGGGDLAAWLALHPGTVSPRSAARFVARIGSALDYCHGENVVHLDLKPSNILLVPAQNGLQLDGNPQQSGEDRSLLDDLHPKIADFGLARGIENGLSQTSTSMFLGTPLYMAPEQVECRREWIGPATDIFSLGVILHEMLTGRRPFEGESAIEVLNKIRMGQWRDRSSMSGVPREMQTILQRCLCHDVDQRYQSATELTADLNSFAEGQTIAATPVSWSHRLLTWCRQPTRIVQTGLVTVVIQGALLSWLVGMLCLFGMGPQAIRDTVDLRAVILDVLPLALGFHLPLFLIGIYAMRHRRWPIFIGMVLTVIPACMTISVIIHGESVIKIYQGQPLMMYNMHLIVLALLLIQFGCYVTAIPAALPSSFVQRTSK